jgi:hypothetical protein
MTAKSLIFHICALVLTIFLCFSFVSCGNADADSTTSETSGNETNSEFKTCDNFYYKENANSTVTILGLVDINKINFPFLIPASINGKVVYSISSYAFSNVTDITTAIISDGISVIESNAFSYCTNLTDITIPNSVTVIGDSAFIGNTKMTRITFGAESKLNTIENYAFYGCEGLKKLQLPSSLKSIGDHAFSDLTSLEELDLPSNLQSIGTFAFANCKALNNVHIPSSVQTMGSYAFSGSNIDILISVDLPSAPSGWASDWNPKNFKVNWIDKHPVIFGGKYENFYYSSLL